MEEGISFGSFEKNLEEIVKVSNSLMDGWQIYTKEGIENGKYITKKSTSCIEIPNAATDTVIITLEYHVAYHLSYGVPILCFNAWKQDGCLLTLEEFWNSNKNMKDLNMFETLTQMVRDDNKAIKSDHPVLCRPFLTLHPCKTHEIMGPFLENSKNPVVSWLSVVGHLVGLTLLDEYLKLC